MILPREPRVNVSGRERVPVMEGLEVVDMRVPTCRALQALPRPMRCRYFSQDATTRYTWSAWA